MGLRLLIPTQSPHSSIAHEKIIMGCKKSDHTECMVPRSFIWTSAMFVSQGPTPAVRPSEWTLSSVGEPCLSAASWLALPCLASISFHEAGRGVNGFGYFCRNKSGSAAGPNPGNTEKHSDTGVRYQMSNAFTDQRFSTGTSHDTFRYT